MMKYFLALLICLSAFKASSQLFSLQWERTFRGHFENANFRVNASSTDAGNNFYFVGNKDTSVRSKIFFFKYMQDGTPDLYVEYYEPYPAYLIGYSICTDINGNIFIGGWRTDPQTIDFLLLKYDTQGNLVWQFSEPVTMDNNNPDRLNINLSSDSAGAIYYAYHNADSAYYYTLKCGKVNANGIQVWQRYLSKNYDKLLAFKIRTDNKLEVAIGAMTEDSILVSLYDTSFIHISSYAKSTVSPKTAFIDEFDNIYLLTHYIDIFSGSNDSDLVIKLDPNLNERWSIKHQVISYRDFLNGKGSHLYWFNETGLFKIDTSGFVSWQAFTGNYNQSVEVNSLGDAYISYSYNTHSSVHAVIEKFDSSGIMTQSRNYMNYVYPISVLNNNSSFMSGMWDGCCGKSGNQILYFDSSFTDSATFSNTNYQHKVDINFKSLRDNQNNLIDISRLVDTVVHSGFYAYPGLCISKFDTTGSLLWKKNFSGSPHGTIYYKHSCVDVNNNVYTVIRHPFGTPSIDRIIKISADGVNSFQYSFYDSILPGRYEITSVTADNQGNLYAAGTRDTSSNYNSDAVLIKLDSILNPVWIKYISIQQPAFEIAENLQFWHQSLVFTVRSVMSGLGKDYVCEYDTAGNPLLTLPVNSSITPYRTLMKAGNSGVYTLTGISIPPEWFVVKMDNTGSIICEWQDSSALQDWNNNVTDLAIDNNDNAYVIGSRTDGISGIYYLRKFNDCNCVWTDSISGFIGSSISLSDSIIFASGTGYDSDFSPITLYDTAGTILFRDSVPCFSGYPVSISGDQNGFYVSSNIRTDSGGIDIDIRRYMNSLLTNLSHASSEKSVLVYPNPAQNKIRINSAKSTLFAIDIYNISNQLVFSKRFSNDNYLISLPELLNGQYFYLIRDENKSVHSGTFMIVK